jgi:hypothetical protein
MLWLTVQYFGLILINVGIALVSFKMASSLHKKKNSGAIGAVISGVVNVVCVLAVLAIYFNAMYFGQ